MKSKDINWVLLAPSGKLALCRNPLQVIPPDCRIASGAELLCANRGSPFPWGSQPSPHPHNRHWREQRLGVGGLFHQQWFVTSDGRYGGAANVPEELPGSLRSSLLYDGGGLTSDQLAENEGYAVVRSTTLHDQNAFREIQMYAATHVMADGGAIICSPINDCGVIHVGFVGRCQICPNAELVSFEQLKKRLPKYTFELWKEWKNWSVGPKGV